VNTWRCDNLSLEGRVGPVGLAVARAEVVALVGPSGSGKSTLLALLAGLLEPTTGQVARCPGRLGMMFQEPALWDHLRVQQHLSLLTDDRSYVADLLDRTRLTGLARRRPSALSGGEQQRLSFARALAVRPEWLLLDEPTAHLDGASRDEMLELLAHTLTSTDAGVLLATHEADVALGCADRIVAIIDGAIVQAGPAEEVYHQPVTLEVARLLGPAFALRGTVRGGTLCHASGAALLSDPSLVAGADQTLIVRPADLRFVADPQGAARGRRAVYQGSCFDLEVEVGVGSRGTEPCVFRVQHPVAVDVGLRGVITR